MILNELIGQSIEVVGKGVGDSIFYFTFVKNINGKSLVVSLSPGSPAILRDEVLIVNFSHSQDRYFFQSEIVLGEGLLLAVPDELFILQRRKTPRLSLPPEYPGHLNIVDLSGKRVFLETKILDFSSGGCRVLYPSLEPNFLVDLEFKAFLHVGKKNPFELHMQVRHWVEAVLTDGKKGQIFGLQFKFQSLIEENRLLVMFMDLQREVFINFSESSSLKPSHDQ